MDTTVPITRFDMKASEYVRGDEHMAVAVYRFLAEHVLTERSTDMVLDLAVTRIAGFTPWFVPLAIVRKIVDSALPEQVLGILRSIIVAQGWATERQMHEANPFRKD